MEESSKDHYRDESQIESPAWHEDFLREREEAVRAGKETFIDWEEAKKQIWARTKKGN